MSYAPTPDIVFRPSAALRDAVITGTLPDKVLPSMRSAGLDPTLTRVLMSLRDVTVIDNRDIGRGDIYVVTLVTDNISPEPMTLSVKTFADVEDGASLTLGPSGIAMYRNPAPKVPEFLDFRILVMESDQELRDTGGLIAEVTADPTYVSFRDNLLKVGGVAPTAALATAAGDFVLGLIGRLLRMNRDDQLIYVAGSFDAAFDDLGTTLGDIVQKTPFARVTYGVRAA
jgi:hypothetical protein